MKNYFFDDFFLGKAPLVAKNIQQVVFDNYRVEDFPEGIQHPGFDNSKFYHDINVSQLFYERFTGTEKIEQKILLPKGKYILWDYNDKYRIYNPIEETPDIFIKFSRIGAQKKISQKNCLAFVEKYGVLRLVEGRGLSVRNGYFYPAYSIEAFVAYAREAYLIFLLHHLLKEEDKSDRIRNHLKQVGSFIPGGFDTLGTIINWESLFHKKWKDIYPDYKNKLRAYFPNEWDEALLGLPHFIPGVSLGNDFWNVVIAEAPENILKEIAVDIITGVTNLRINDDITFSCSPTYQNNKNFFVNKWSSSSLLAVMWFLFYLEITGQIVSNKYCEYCSKPITPLEGRSRVPENRKYCYDSPCKQAAYQDRKAKAFTI